MPRGFSALLQSNISKHLGFLGGQGIVVAERRGMRVFYRLADKRIVRLLEDVEEGVKGTLKAKVSLVA